MDWLDIKEFIKDTIKYIIFIVVVLFIAIYVIGLQQIVGDSMSPTLKNNNIVLIDKFTPRFLEIKRGDIVTFYYDETKYLIKRIIGMPGEYIEIKNNKIYIDNKPIQDYVEVDSMMNFKLEFLGYDKIPEDMYFVMGDNRGNSLDSRDYRVGLIKKEDIVGKQLIKVWPLTK